MFYISCIRGNMVGVTDSEDGVEEMYEKSELKKIVDRGIKIKGVSKDGFTCYIDTLSKLEKSLIAKAKTGCPLIVRVSKDAPKRQAIYISRESIGISKAGKTYFNHVFFDGTLFSLSSKFLLNHESEVKFDFDNNDPVEVAKLRTKMGKM